MNSKEKLWNANYIKVMTTNFLLYFAFYLLTPLLPLYLSETFGATKDTIGIVLSGYTVAALIVRPFCGYVVDSFFAQESAHAVPFGLCRLLCRIHSSRHNPHVCHLPNIAWRTLRSRHRSQQHLRHPRAAFQPAKRRHRTLWYQQQLRHGDSSIHRHLSAATW